MLPVAELRGGRWRGSKKSGLFGIPDMGLPSGGFDRRWEKVDFRNYFKEFALDLRANTTRYTVITYDAYGNVTNTSYYAVGGEAQFAAIHPS